MNHPPVAHARYPPGRPAAPSAAELASRARSAVDTYRAAGPGADVVTLRGRAIEAALEAALVHRGESADLQERTRWTLEAWRMRGDEPAYDREEQRT